MKVKLLFLLFIILCSACVGETKKCNHNYVVSKESASTCIEQGVKEETCSICGDVITTKKALIAHVFEERIISPTCEKEGYTLKICSVCSYEEKVNVTEKIPHTYAEEIISPTCEKEGYTLKTCSVCSYEEKVNITEKLPHKYDEEVIEPTCEEVGYTKFICSECGDEKQEEIAALGHDFSNWTTIVDPTPISDGMQKRECLNCGKEEFEYIIIATNYVDLSIVRETFDSEENYSFDDYTSMLLKFEAAVLHMTDTFTCTVNFEFASFQELLQKLIDECRVPFSFKINAQLLGETLTISFTYNNIPTKTTENLAYTQHQSLNYQPINATRQEDYNEFKINDSIYSFEVSTSEQLHYVLERGVKPICEQGSDAEIVYEKIKVVLRQIIDDNMTDLEKVIAIHDYLVMNVTYDNDLLEALYAGDNNLKKYRGFYLEGVFLDNKAVCEGISKAFTAMCNMEGIPCVSVEGYQTQNPSGAGHAWNKVYLNNKWYIVDATSDGTIINSSFEVLSYKYFLISETNYSSLYTGETYLDILCEDTIDVYAMKKFSSYGTEYDFVIDSQTELKRIVAYFENNSSESTTIEFKINFDCGDSAVDEIQKAYQSNFIFVTPSYIENGNIFMLIK